jgi:hypothetical protein
MEQKVYCKNCKYEAWWFDLIREFNLECKYGYYNYHNECGHYIRKWWKFWVKEK